MRLRLLQMAWASTLHRQRAMCSSNTDRSCGSFLETAWVPQSCNDELPLSSSF